ERQEEIRMVTEVDREEERIVEERRGRKISLLILGSISLRMAGAGSILRSLRLFGRFIPGSGMARRPAMISG
ncbi:MAG: hypothetical protein ACOC1S_04010, partial [bacterium]